MIEAELHDGTVLEFPDGTADDVIQRTVKSQLASRPKADDSRMQISPETQRVRDIDATKMKQRELAEINQGLGMPRTPDDERRMRIAKDAVEKELAVMGAPLTEAKQPVAPTPAPKPSDAGLPSFKDVRSSAETVPQLTPAEEARGSRAAFPANVQRKNVRAALPTQPVVAPAPAVAAPTAQELETASRPARMVATKGGKPLIVPESELRSRDVWDPETQGERRAPWTGEGGVMESLPGQFVAGSNQVGAQLRRMSAQGGVNERTTLVNQPPIAETRGGAASGMVAPGSLERQGRMLARDKSDLQRAELDAARAKGDMEAITPANMNFPQQAVSSLAQSAAPTLAGIGLGIVTRSPQLAMAIAGIGGGSLQAGSTYGEARDKGASHRTASLAASVGFITEALGEALPIGIAMKPGSRIAARLFDTVLAEAGQEAATQMMQDLSAYALYDPEMTLKKSWDNMKLAAFAGGMGGVAYGGIGHAAAWQPPKGSDADLAAVMDDKRPLKDIRAEQDKINAAVAFDRAAAQHAAMVAQGAAPVTAAAQPVASVPLPPIVMPEQPQAAQPQQISEAPKGEATPAAPIIADHIDHVDVAAERVDTGATPAQKEAGNYAKGHFRFGEGNALSGLGDIAIETPRGETRVAADGSWETPPLPAHYGEIKMAKGADGDKLDLFVGQNVDSTKVFLIDQIDPKTGKFDEHKALVGFNSEQEAVKAYMDSYSDDARPRIGNVSTLGARQFVNWVRNGNTKKAFNYQQPVQEKQNVPESKAAAPANEERPAASAQEHVPAGPQASTAPSEAAPSQPAGVIQREQAPVQEADASANERGIAPAPREPAPAAQQERPAAAPPAASVPAGNGLTYRVGRHSKTGALLHVVNISDRVSRDEYVSLKAKAKAAGGYYSKFVKGFIFPTEEQARSFAGEKSAPKQLETRTSTEPKPNIEQQAANITDSEFDSMFDEVSGEVAQASVPKRAEPQKVSWTEWSDIGNGYQARSSTSHPTQEIKTPNGNIITRGLDTNGRSYMEFESDTNPFTKGGMSWVDAAQKDLQSLSLPKLAGGTTTKAPAAPKPPSITGAATHAKAAVKAGLQGLDELFGKGGTLGSGPVVTPEGWAKAKPHFDAAFAEAVAAGKELRDFVRDILTRYNNSAAIKPYMKRWLDEYRAGRNTPEHVGKSDAPGAPALEGVPADEVRGTEKVGETGRSPESGGEPDISGDEHLDRQRDTAARGVDADAGTVPAAAGREQGQGREGNRESGLRRDNAVEGGQAENSERGGRSDATVTPGAPFPRPENFVITDEIELGKGGVATKYRDNVAAIKLLKQIESEGRLATPDEQKILARYVGWGGIKNAFPNPNVTPPEGWAKRAVEMKELLTPDEHEAAARSIQDAHYTSRTIVDGIWQAAQRLGFTAGRVLEPAMGTGNFFGLMPEALRATAALTGIEYDSITARIAKQLYPQADVRGQRDIEDVSNDSMSAAEMKALASGNPLILEDVKLTENIRKLEGQKRRHDSNVRELQGQITRYENRIQNLPAIIDRNQPVYDAIKSYLADPYEGDPPRADVDGTRMDRTEALAHVNAVMKQADETVVVQNAGIETEKQAIQEKSKESKPGTSEHAELSKQYEELNKKLAKPQWSVSIDGTPYTSKASVIEAIQSILGDAYPVKITVEGEPLTRRSDIAERFEPIVEKLDEDAKGRTVAGQIAGQDIEFEWDETEKTRGMTVNIGSESTFIRDESVERDQGKKVTGARALSVVGGLLKENIAAHETNVANLKAARAGIGQLKEQGVGEWGKQLELDTDKARIKEVRKMLSENLTAPAETQEETQGEGPEVLKSTGMPQQMAGHVGRPTAGIPGNAAPGPDPQRIRDIIKIVRDELGIPVRQGNFAQRALGIYKRKRGVIRQRALDDIRVFAHEAGHAISEKYEKVLLPIQKQHRLELTRMAYPGAAKNQLREEGFAEFIRLYLTNRLAALRAAPSFEKDFRTAMDAAAPELMKRMDQMTDAYMLWRTASSTQVIGAGIVKARKKPTFISKSIERGLPKTISAVAEDAYRGVVDDKAPIRIAVAMLKDVKNQNAGKRIPLKMVEDAYKLDALANYSFGTGHEEILHGVIPFEQVDPITRGLPEAISVAIGKTAHDWNDAAIKLFDGYLLSRRAVHEWGRYERGELKNEPTAQTKGDHEQNIIDMEAAHPTFKDGADIVYEWVQALWSKKLDAGLITQDQYDAGVKNHPDYVPMMRDMDDGVDIAGPGTTGATGKGSNVKAFHGSLRDVVSPLQSLMKDAFATEMAIARNEVKKALIKLAESAGLGGASIAERIPANQASAITASIEQVTEHLTKSIDWRALSPRDAQSLAQAIDMIDDLSLPEMRIYKQGIINEKGKPIVFFFENGKRQAMQLADGEFGRDLYNALTNMNRNQLNVFLQALSVPSAMVRTGVTLDVGYAIGNYLRDQFAAWVLSPNGFIPFVSGAAGLVQHLANTKVAQKARSSGVIMGGSSTAALDDTRVNQDVRAIRETGVNFRRYKHWRALTLLSELSETGTRVGLFARNYNAGIKRGLSEYEAFKYAAYETNDFLNFGRHGSRTLAFRKTFSFAGVSIQGLDKALRTQGGWKYLPAALLPYVKYTKGMDLNEEDMRELGYSAKVMARMMILAVIAVSLRAMIGKDDEYDKMSPRIKATQFLGKIRGNWVSFPKPFELATPANIAELIYEAVYEKDPITFKKMSDRLWPLIEPPHYFNAVGPIAEHWANKRFYDESPILRDKLLGLEPYLQFNRYTSELSKMLGKATNTSPALIDHYVLSYTGTMGRYALQASNLTNPTRPDVGLADAPIARRFFRDPSRGNEATKEFWKLIQQKEGVFSSAYNTFEDLALHGAPGEARKYLDSLKIDQQTYVITKHLHSFSPNDHLDRRHPILRGERALGIISALRDQIATSSTFTPHEKRVIDEQLGKIAMAEARNALISIDRPGFQNRTTLAIANKMTGLQEVSPSAYEMLTTKYNEQKGAVNHKDNAVFTDEDVYAGYPALVQQMQDAKDDIAPPGDEANLPKRKYKNKALPLAVPLTAR